MLLLIVLLIIGAALGILGFILKGVLWLAIIGIVIFVGGLIFGAVRKRSKG